MSVPGFNRVLSQGLIVFCSFVLALARFCTSFDAGTLSLQTPTIPIKGGPCSRANNTLKTLLWNPTTLYDVSGLGFKLVAGFHARSSAATLARGP